MSQSSGEQSDELAQAEALAETQVDESRPGFLDEVRHFLSVLPDKGVFVVLAVAWLLLFQFFGNSTFGYIDTSSLYAWMYSSYNAPLSEDGHGNLIPFVVLILLWWKRDELKGLSLKPWSWAFGLIVGALLLHAIGFIAQQPRISIVALVVGFYGIMGLCWGFQWLKNTFFPFFLFAFSVPIGSLATVITFPLRLLVSEIAVVVATSLLGLDIVREGTMIFDADRSFQYDVAPACSGIRSLITLFAFTTIYGFITYRSLWRRIVMMLASVPLAIIGNVLRITTVIAVGDIYGMKAGLKIEQKLGILTFIVAIVGVMALGHFLREAPLEAKEHEEN